METNNKDLRFFVILTYVSFYISLGLCLVIAAFGVPMESISNYAPVVISWVSLAVLMIWAKRLLKGSSRKKFLKGLQKNQNHLNQMVLIIVF